MGLPRFLPFNLIGQFQYIYFDPFASRLRHIALAVRSLASLTRQPVTREAMSAPFYEIIAIHTISQRSLFFSRPSQPVIQSCFSLLLPRRIFFISLLSWCAHHGVTFLQLPPVYCSTGMKVRSVVNQWEIYRSSQSNSPFVRLSGVSSSKPSKP